MKIKYLITLILCSILVVSGCNKNSTSSSVNSSINEGKSIHIEDITLRVGDSIDIEVTFIPASSVTSVTYSTSTIAEIRNGVLTALVPGEDDITCTTIDSISTTFHLTVLPKVEVELTPMELFNKLGTFDDELEGWNLSGNSAEVITVSYDPDRSKEDNGLKLWTDGEVDITLNTTINSLEAGVYTISFEMVGGNLDSALLTLNDEEFSWVTGDIIIATTGYKTSYFVYEVKESENIEFTLTIKGAATNGGWGFLDNIKIEKGNTKPRVELIENLIVNGDFEQAISNWAFIGTYSGTIKQDAGSANNGLYGLNYWANGTSNDSLDIKQTINIEESGTYTLSIMGILGDDNSSYLINNNYIYLTQGTNTKKVELTRTNWNGGVFTKFETEVKLTVGETEVGIHIFTTSGTSWYHLDDFILIKK